MCEQYSEDYGYLCNKCLETLKSNPGIDVEEFMDSNKVSDSKHRAWEVYVDSLFKSTH